MDWLEFHTFSMSFGPGGSSWFERVVFFESYQKHSKPTNNLSPFSCLFNQYTHRHQFLTVIMTTWWNVWCSVTAQMSFFCACFITSCIINKGWSLHCKVVTLILSIGFPWVHLRLGPRINYCPILNLRQAGAYSWPSKIWMKCIS